MQLPPNLRGEIPSRPEVGPCKTQTGHLAMTILPEVSEDNWLIPWQDKEEQETRAEKIQIAVFTRKVG